MRKLMIWAAFMLLLASGCDRGPGGGNAASGPLQSKGRFDLKGQINTLTATSSASARQASPGSPASGGRPRSGVGSPGALAVSISSASSGSDSCKFESKDVVMVLYTTETKFDPSDTPAGRTFPTTLRGRNIQAKGQLFGRGDDECLLVADTIKIEPET